ncbi:MAG TPA: type I-E CRISPR-associated protein Cas5/CasD [Sedimenticola thiotaurini]|uniref:Type I-E CRISPR-associated protein Cas5/CasD n=1 Tax=Sedimenticola thiotaurini TaxID=1543721 RepID=A0A831W471_9GAMM|nr:type I-E CRISPR-associated protein Cas5/CasD [Sedimenticola thiotaurini]
MEALILRLDAPLMSFGGVMIDQHGVIDRFPGHALLTGLIGNALGWRHGDGERLVALQARLRLAARWDVRPKRIVDYHTADLGQPKMKGYSPGKEPAAWTTRGTTEGRGSGDATKGTHIRYRHYWSDGLMTLALALTDAPGPSLTVVHEALRRPARPLFLGRKTCLPARPLLDPVTPVATGPTLRSILSSVPRWGRDGEVLTGQAACEACWPAGEGGGASRRVADRRDWRANLPTGSSLRIEGPLATGEEPA